MTIANTKASSVFNANGVTRDFELGFVYDENVSGLTIKVIDTDGEATEVTDNYSIYNGVLTYPTVASGLDPLASGYKLTVERLTPQTQSIDLIQQGPLDAETLEGGYDKLTLEVQELQDNMDRAIKFPVQTKGETDAQKYIDDLTDLKNTATSAASVATQQASIATTKASEAATSASAAEVSAQNAAASETAAANSAAAAAASEQHTIQNEELLQEYVDQAESSATAAAESETASASSATQAATSATNAASSASTASGYATSAQTYASDASTQATNAANSANTASGYASAAQSSASTATEKANAASQSATAAAGSATLAGTSADNAAASALSASTSASSAQDALAEVQSYRRIDRTYIAGTAIDDYTGSLTVFDLGLGFDLADHVVDVLVNGKGYQGVKDPVDFTVSGDVVTFVEAVPVGAVVQFRINASTTVIIAGSVDVDAKIAEHNTSSTAHSDIRTALTTHTGNANIHVTSSDKSNWNAKQSALSTDQIAATNSGITAAKVSSYDTHVADTDIHVTVSDKSAWNGKQSALSTTQLSATNSGITSAKVSGYDTHVANSDIHVTAAQKTAWSGKQDAISDLATIRSGASAGATALQNTATGDGALTIIGTSTSGQYATNIGGSSSSTGQGATAIGSGTVANGQYACAVGFQASAVTGSVCIGGGAGNSYPYASSNYSIAIGCNARIPSSSNYAISIGNGSKATAQSAIQLGSGTNSTASTFQVFNTTVVDANGKVPTASLEADLTTKANTDLSNVTNTGKSTGAGWGMPSGTYEDLTLGASGTTYTAPANGWLFIAKAATASLQYLDIEYTQSGTVIINNSRNSINTGEIIRMITPVLKGQNLKISYSLGGATSYFRFVYAEGSKSEAN